MITNMLPMRQGSARTNFWIDKKTSKKATKPFRFFDLPRELRDRIYRVALVKELIDIEPVSCASDDDDEETVARHPQPKLRSTYTSLGKVMTYRLAKPRGCSCGECVTEDAPMLQLFYVNRSVYHEAREIFYKENEFSTILSSGIGCNTFFKDREYALPMIRKISLDVPFHTAEFNYTRWTDRHYKVLFKTIKEKTGIRKLTLNFHGKFKTRPRATMTDTFTGLVPNLAEDKWKCPCDCQAWEHPLLALGQAMGIDGVPSSKTGKMHNNEWNLIKALTTGITDLSRLSVNVDFCYHMLDHEGHDEAIFEHEHIRNFIAYMRTRMLKKGEALGATQIHGYCRVHNEVEDKRYRFHCDDDEYGKSHLELFKNKSSHPSAHHDHADSGSELDDDADLPDLEDLSDFEGEWEDEEDSDGDDSDMPPLEDSTDDEMPVLDHDDLD